MKRPLVAVAMCYGAGLLVAEFLQPSLKLLFAASLCLAGGALMWTAARRWLLWPLLLLAGWTNLASRTAVVSPVDLRLTQGESAEIVTLRGTLSETPSQRLYIRDERERARSLALVDVSHLRGQEQEWRPAFGRVLVATPGVLPKDYYAGYVVEITGVLALPPGRQAEGLFDYRAYLRRQSVYYQLQAESPGDWRLISAKRPPPLGDRFLAWAQTTLARGLPQEDEPLHLLWAMTLGWKTGMTNEVYEPFMRSGTMHIFAISGLHIALIAGILVSLLRVLRVSRAWCGLIIIPLIWFYTCATGWQPSAIRSVIMMTIIIGGWALERPSNLVNSLAAAAFIILLWDPQQLFGASFQLSFFVVLSIALLMPPLERWRERLLRTDPLLPAGLVPRWRRWLDTPLRWVTTCFATSLAAWLGSWPLTAYYFHLFSPVTLLANLVIVPLSSFALAANLGGLICGDWLPWATELFNHSAWWWMACMVKLSNWSILLPKAYLYVREPALVDFVIYYVLLVGLLSGWLVTTRRRCWALAGVALALGGLYCWRWRDSEQTATLTVLPASGGMSLYCRASGEPCQLLLDTGTTNTVEFTTRPFLRAQGVNHLPNLLLTHGDLRHVGGAMLLADQFSAKHVYASQARSRSPVYRRALAEFDHAGRLRRLCRNEHVGLWTVLHPDSSDRFPRADDNSLVLCREIDGTRVLLLSDLGPAGQDALLERAPGLRADIVVAGLPAVGEALSDPLLDAIQPRLVIVADSEFPANERAPPQLQMRLARRRIRVIYTREVGSVKILFGKHGWRLSTVDGVTIASSTESLSR